MATYTRSLQTFLYLLLCFGHIQSKNKVIPLEVKIETEVKIFQPTKIEKRQVLYLILATHASNFHHSFGYIQFKNKDAKLAVSTFLKIEKVQVVSRTPYGKFGHSYIA